MYEPHDGLGEFGRGEVSAVVRVVIAKDGLGLDLLLRADLAQPLQVLARRRCSTQDLRQLRHA